MQIYKKPKMVLLKNKTTRDCPLTKMPRSSPAPLATTPSTSHRNPCKTHAYGAPLGTHQYPPTQGGANNINLKLKNQTLKANINIASLNINGYTAPANNMSGIDKWSSVYQTMKKNKTAIIALQETHLDDTTLHAVNQCFGKRLTVINSKLPTNLRTSAGVAFVINRTLVAPQELETVELIPGRALAIKFKWHKDKEIVIINVYAPNNRNEHQDFWEQLDSKRRAKGLRRPDFLLGDFNMTEDPIDRAPAHLDDANTIAALRNLRQCLKLKDTWCHAFPHDRCFTFRANNDGQQIKSRLDRIYTSDDTAKATFAWKIQQTSVPTDHWMVSTKYTPANAPFIGKGRWSLRSPELKDAALKEKLIERGKNPTTQPPQLGNEQYTAREHKPTNPVGGIQK
jgi:exonuclease III